MYNVHEKILSRVKSFISNLSVLPYPAKPGACHVVNDSFLKCDNYDSTKSEMQQA